MMSLSCFLLQIFMLWTWLPCVHASEFLSQRGGLIDFEELEQDLREAADASGGAARIEKKLWRTFAALPKNEFGRVSPVAVRYAVHSYFSNEYGWLIEGLGSPGSHFNSTEKHGASIMQERVPAYVEAMLEQKQSGHGLALDDIVLMVIVLERLVLDENVASMNEAYELSGVSLSSSVDEGTLMWVHRTWVSENFNGVKREENKSMYKISATTAKQFEHQIRAFKIAKVETRYDAVLNYKYAYRHVTNPFSPRPYSTSASLEIAHEWAQQDQHRCRELKAHLVELDPRGSGRVPLHVFHAQEHQSHGFLFAETVEYLRSISALDESEGSPHVLIANYVASPGNCNRHTTYYSACCTSGCEAVMHEIEGTVLAPEVSPELLAHVASNISTASVETPRQLPSGLVEKLHSIATLHGGVVPLHGRLFSQWLHFAFPSECPHVKSYTTFSMREHWLDFESSKESILLSKEERASRANMSVAHAFAAEPSLQQWDDHEVLPFAQTRAHSAWHQVSQFTGVLAVCIAIARAGGAAWCSVTRQGDSSCSKEKWAQYV